MPASILGNRIATYKEPAWHQLGTTYDEEVSAQRAYDAMGHLKVELVPVYAKATRDDGSPVRLKLPNQAIVRSPIDEDPEYVTFGLVSQDYTLITPDDAVRIWDEHVGRPIETMGFLHRGENLFITCTLPDFNLRGDEIKRYLLLDSPMTGNDSCMVHSTPVRTVCQNTLTLARGMASESYRIVHDQQAKARLGTWLQGIYDRALAKQAVIEEAFEVLANHQVTSNEVEYVLEQTYPLREMTRFDAPDEVLDRREQRIEAKNRLAIARREAAQDLFEGMATGYRIGPFAGTTWGLYNSIVELEDYRRGVSTISTAEDSVFGKRAATKEKAFSTTLYVAKGAYSPN